MHAKGYVYYVLLLQMCIEQAQIFDKSIYGHQYMHVLYLVRQIIPTDKFEILDQKWKKDSEISKNIADF